jgi:hypothetical protein
MVRRLRRSGRLERRVCEVHNATLALITALACERAQRRAQHLDSGEEHRRLWREGDARRGPDKVG